MLTNMYIPVKLYLVYHMPAISCQALVTPSGGKHTQYLQSFVKWQNNWLMHRRNAQQKQMRCRGAIILVRRNFEAYWFKKITATRHFLK